MYNIYVDKYKPMTFQEYIGNEYNKELLSRIIENIYECGKTILLTGEYGVGKSTLANIFCNELGKKYIVKRREFNCSLLNKDILKEIIEYVNSMYYYDKIINVIILDEFHLLSNEAQSLLLNVMENNNKNNIYYIIVSSNENKILKTVISRCMYRLNVNKLSDNELKLIYDRIRREEGIEIREDILNVILEISNGKIRDFVHYLNFYNSVKDDNIFLNMVNGCYENVCKFFDEYDESSLKDIMRSSCNMVLNSVSRYISKNVNRLNEKFIDIYYKYKEYVVSDYDMIGFLKMLYKANKGNRR